MDYHRKSSCESPWGPLQSAYPLAELPADRDAQLLAVDPRATVASIVYGGVSSSCVIKSEPSITSENNACLKFQGGRLPCCFIQTRGTGHERAWAGVFHVEIACG